MMSIRPPLERARSAEHPRGKHEEPAQQAEDPVNRDTDNPEWNQEDPDEGIEQQREQGKRPAEDEQNAPEQEFHHTGRYDAVAREVASQVVAGSRKVVGTLLLRYPLRATSYQLPPTTYHLLATTLRRAQQQAVLRCNAGGNRLGPDSIALLLQVHRAHDVNREGAVNPAGQSAVIA